MASDLGKTAMLVCPNCNVPQEENSRFCSHCGQKRQDKPPTLLDFVGEAVSSLYNFEGKFWRTLAALFVPGRLTQMHRQGRRERYISPLRLFLLLSLVFLTVVSSTSRQVEESITQQVASRRQRMNEVVFLEDIQREADTLKIQFPVPERHEMVDTLLLRIKRDREDSISLMSIPFAAKDLLLLSPDSLLASVQADTMTYVNRLVVRQNIRFFQAGESFWSFALSKASWMLLLMMPVLAGILKLVYWRRRMYYVEHLVFSFHTHGFAFLMLSIILLIASRVSDWVLGWLWPLGLLCILIYVVMALKRVYGQRWGRTLFKSALLFFIYTVMLGTALGITAVAAAALF